MPSFEIVLALLAAVAFLAAVGRRISVANPILFAIGGLVLALIPGIPVIKLPPNIVLTIFLPPLIYAAAQETSWAEMRQNARPILFLAIGLVLVTMCAVAAVFHAIIPDLPWPVAFTLGAIVGPPDAVAAKSVADTLKLPRRVVAVLEGEGLVNDATALIAFNVASGILIAGTQFNFGSAALLFGYSSLVAPLIGIVVGWIGLKILRPIDDPATENTIMLLMPFGTYLVAEELHTSGVLAVLALALYFNEYNGSNLSAAGRLIGRAFWEMIDFLLTGLSFILIGLQLRSIINGLSEHPRNQVLFATTAVCVVVVLVRPLWVFIVAWLSGRFRGALLRSGSETPPKKGLVLVGWAGMRGVISLAIALSLPIKLDSGQPFPGRDLVVFATFVVILVTLVGQGLTLPALIKRLGIRVNDSETQKKEISVRLHLAQTGYDAAQSVGTENEIPASAIERARSMYTERIEYLQEQCDSFNSDGERSETEGDATKKLMQLLLKVEQKELQRMRNAGEIEAPLARGLQKDVDVKRVIKKPLH